MNQPRTYGVFIALAVLVAPTVAAADDHYWVTRVDVDSSQRLVRGITDDGRLAMSDESSPEQALFYDIHSGEVESAGHPDYSGYATMTLFALSDTGDVGGRGNRSGEGSRPIAYVEGQWVAPSEPAEVFNPQIVGVGEDGSLVAEGNSRGAYLPPGKVGGDDWIVLPRLVPEADKAFDHPSWVGAGEVVYGTATLKWFEWELGNGDYIDRAVRWTQSGSEWSVEQLLPAPDDWTGNDDPDAKNDDTWRSHFVAGNEAGEVVGWLQEAHEAPLQLAKHDASGWTFLTPLIGTEAASPEDLNDNGVAIGAGEAVNNEVAVVWDIRTDTAWNLNRSVDPNLKLIFTEGAAINDRGQILARAKCEAGSESWYVLSPKQLGSPNLSAHDVEVCTTEPSDDSLGPEGNGNQQGLPPPADGASTPPSDPDGSGGVPGGSESPGVGGGVEGPGGAENSDDGGQAGGSEEGCGCHLAGSTGGHGGWLLLALGALPLLRRRRSMA